MPLLRAMKLYEQDDSILIVASDTSIKEALTISRQTGTIEETKRPSGLRGAALVIFGIVGLVTLPSGPYLLVITASPKVGRLFGKDVFVIRTVQAVAVGPKTSSSPTVASDDTQYLTLLLDLLHRNPFYFSYDLDLTNSAQRSAQGIPDAPLYQRADPRFFWNRHLLTPFITAVVNDWILPIMMGHIDIQNNIVLSNKKFDFALISRRSIHRAGLRYVVRGIDEHGNVANYVETEQLLINEQTIASFVQTRGSIPVFWSQKVNLKYKPKPEILRDSDAALPFTRAHFEEQERLYGKQIAVNLIDQKGSELVLANSYGEQVRKLSNPNITYIPFDFHTECKAMKYENINLKLVKQIESELQANGYFWSENGKVLKTQTGVVRTNCMDNLDRSNVVQSVIARHVLRTILSEFSVGENADFEQRFKNVWANNADAISMQYTGTGALKTDFTRTGKRSTAGVLDDGRKSVLRYYLNNFVDGDRQDGFDLFLGNYQITPGAPSPFNVPRKNFPLIMGVFVLVLVVALLLSLFDLLPVSLFFVLIVWIPALGFFLKTALASGTDWVIKPRLVASH